MLQDVGIRLVVLGVGTFNRDTNLARSTLTGLDRAVEGTASKLNQIGTNLSRVGQLWTTTITVPILVTTGALIASGIQFEDAFAGVSKTVEGVANDFGELTVEGEKIRQQFRALALEIPISVNELARIGEAGGALGITRGEITEFTKTVAMLGVTTNMTSDEAANFFARLGNVMGVASEDMAEFTAQAGSTVVELGNKFAATESEIAALSLRIAGAAQAAGVSTPEVLGLSAAIASLGIQSELGGSAVSRVFLELKRSADDFTATGGEATDQIKLLAKAFGGTVQEFVAMQKADPTTTFLRVVGGLNDMQEAGTLSADALRIMNFDTIRLQDVLNRLGPNIDLVANALGISAEEWKTQTALQIEAQKRFATTKSQLILLKNAFVELGITLFDLYAEPIKALIAGIKTVVLGINALNESSLRWIVRTGAIVAAIGPLLIVLGSFIQLLGTLKGVATVGAAAIGGLSAPLIIVTGLMAAFGIAWSKNFLGIKDTAPKVIKEIKNVGYWVGKAFEFGKATKGGNLFTGISAAVRSLTYVYEDHKTTFFSNILQAFGMGEEQAQSLGMTIRNILAPSLEFLSFTLLVVGNLYGAISSAVSTIISDFLRFTGVTTILKNALDAFLSGDFETGFSLIKLAWEHVVIWFNYSGKDLILNALRSIVNIIVTYLKDAVKVLIEAVGPWIGPFVEWAKNVAIKVVDALGDLISNIKDWIVKQAPIIAEKLLDWAKKFVDWVVDMLPDLLKTLEGLATDVIGWIGDKVVDLVEQLLLWGAAFLDWLGPVLKDIVPKLTEFVGKILGRLAYFIIFELPPLLISLAAKFISWVGNALIDIGPELAKFLKAVVDFVLYDIIPGVINATVSLGKGFVDGFKKGIEDNWPSLTNLILDHLKKLSTDYGFGEPDKKRPPLGFASGGPINKPGIVGEEGPELFIPGTSGYILNNQLTKMLSGAFGGVSLSRPITTNSNVSNRAFSPTINGVQIEDQDQLVSDMEHMYRMATLANY